MPSNSRHSINVHYLPASLACQHPDIFIKSIMTCKFCGEKLVSKLRILGPYTCEVTDYGPISLAYCCLKDNQVHVLLLTCLAIQSPDHLWASGKWKIGVDGATQPWHLLTDDPGKSSERVDLSPRKHSRSFITEVSGQWDPNSLRKTNETLVH